jgi:hypothetical protein
MNPARYSLAGFSFLELQEIVWVNCDGGADRALVFSRMHACTHARMHACTEEGREHEVWERCEDAERREKTREAISLLR